MPSTTGLSHPARARCLGRAWWEARGSVASPEPREWARGDYPRAGGAGAGADGVRAAGDRADNAVARVGEDPLAAGAAADDRVAGVSVADDDEVVSAPGVDGGAAEEVDDLVVAGTARGGVGPAVAVDVVVPPPTIDPVVALRALKQYVV